MRRYRSVQSAICRRGTEGDDAGRVHCLRRVEKMFRWSETSIWPASIAARFGGLVCPAVVTLLVDLGCVVDGFFSSRERRLGGETGASKLEMIGIFSSS